MDVGLIDLLTQLKVVSMINSHERFSTSGSMISIHHGGMLQGMWRWLFGEDRTHNMVHLTMIINRAIAHMDTNHASAQQVKKELIGAKQGLKNLSITYDNDVLMKAKLSLLIDAINHVVGEKTVTENQ